MATKTQKVLRACTKYAHVVRQVVDKSNLAGEDRRAALAMTLVPLVILTTVRTT